MGSGEIPATLTDYDDEWEDVPQDNNGDNTDDSSAVDFEGNDEPLNQFSVINAIHL